VFSYTLILVEFGGSEIINDQRGITITLLISFLDELNKYPDKYRKSTI